MEALITGILRDIKTMAENPTVSVTTEVEVEMLAKANYRGAVSSNAGITVRGRGEADE